MDANAPHDLLQEARWLERLAVGLVGDAHTAADLAQQAWLAADAATPVGRRAWLAATLQKLAVRVRRQSARLARRERVAAKPEALASAAELTERAEQHERLIAHVRALAEPYRVAVLLRYYDGLPPRAIAERLGVPVRTVHTRLQRALEQLRARLDAEHPGGRAGWVGALLLARVPQSVAPASAFVAWIALGVAAATLLGWWLLSGFAPAASVAVGEQRAAAAESEVAASRPARHVVVDAAEAPAWSGQVVDWDGFPLASAKVRVVEHLGLRLAAAMFDGPDQLLEGEALTLPAPTDALGRFVGPRPAGPVVVYAELAGHTTALAGVWRAEHRVPLRVALAPAIDLERVVLDGAGRPLAGVRARVSLGEAAQWHVDPAAAGQHAMDWCAISSADGWLRLRGISAAPGATLTLQCAGFRTATLRLGPVASDLPAGALALQPDPDWRTGRVLDARGEPIAGAYVVAGEHTVRSDADGRFAAALSTATELGVAAPGLAPLCAFAPAGEAVEFRLTTADLQFAGRVRDSAGRPRVGFEVSLVDPTVVGAPLRPQVLESLAVGGDGFVLRAVTDAVGGFTLRGLADRPYRLRVVDPRTAAQFETAPLRPSDGVAIAWPDTLLHAEVRARVLAADGSPLAGAHVGVQAHAYVVPPLGDAAPATLFAHGANAVADAEGRLTLTDVPRRGAWLRIYHAATLRDEVALPEVLPAELVLDVPRWAQLTVGYRAALGDEIVELLDASGAPLAVRQVRALGEQTQLEVRLRQGRSPLLTMPETAVAVRVRHGPRELARAPLALRLGGFVHIDL